MLVYYSVTFTPSVGDTDSIPCDSNCMEHWPGDKDVL